MKPILIIGSGISGLSASIFLRQRNVPVHIWEKESYNGGLLAPIDFHDVPCDRGSHRVHPDSHELLRILTSSENWVQRPRRGILLLDGKQLPYPPSPLAFLKGLGTRKSLSMALGFATRPNQLSSFKSWEKDRRINPNDDEGFEDFVIQRVGRSAYDKFYRPYVEKVWGLEPSLISKTVAKQRVSISNPLQTFKASIGQKHKGVKNFFYPLHGIGQLIKNLRTRAQDLGVNIYTGKKFDIHTDYSFYDSVLYSGHLSDISPKSTLQHRGLYILHFAFPKGIIGNTDTWYAPEKFFWFGRVSQPSQFCPTLEVDDCDILCIEIPEGKWGTHKDFLEDTDVIVTQLFQAGIISKTLHPIRKKQTWIPKVYPLYERRWFSKWQQTLREIEDQKNIFPIGRQGLFLHCNMDHCVQISSEVVEHVLNDKDSSIWIHRCSEFLDLRVKD